LRGKGGMRLFYKKVIAIEFINKEEYPKLAEKIDIFFEPYEGKKSILANIKPSGVLFKMTSVGEYLDDIVYIFIPNDFILYIVME